MGKATQLDKSSGRLRRGSRLIGMQAGSFGSSKCTMLTYLDKNNSSKSIQCPMKTKRRNAISATFCASELDLEDEF